MAWADFIPVVGAGIDAFGQNQANQTNQEIASRNRNMQIQMFNSAQDFNKTEATTARQFAEMESSRNRQWQEKMSSSSFQRGTRDMRKAGINPMVAFMKGGASTPGGAQAQSAKGQSPGVASGAPARVENIARGVGTGLQLKRLQKDLSQADAEISLKKQAQVTAATQERMNISSAKIAEAKLPGIKAQSEAQEAIEKINKKLAPLDAVGNRISQWVNPATSLYDMYQKHKKTRSQKKRTRNTDQDKRKGDPNPWPKDWNPTPLN